MRLLGGRFFLDGAKQALFWLCKLGNGAATELAWRSFLANIPGKWVWKIFIRASIRRSRSEMGVPWGYIRTI